MPEKDGIRVLVLGIGKFQVKSTGSFVLLKSAASLSCCIEISHPEREGDRWFLNGGGTPLPRGSGARWIRLE